MDPPYPNLDRARPIPYRWKSMYTHIGCTHVIHTTVHSFIPLLTRGTRHGHSSVHKPGGMANTTHLSHLHASTHTPRLSSASAVDGWVKIPSSSTVGDNALTTNRYHVAVDGRFVSVIRHVDGRGGRHLYCIDSICFHGRYSLRNRYSNAYSTSSPTLTNHPVARGIHASWRSTGAGRH